MKQITCSDKGVVFTMLVREEPPAFPSALEGEVEALRAARDATDQPKEFIAWWRERSEHYSIPFGYTPEQNRLVRSLLKRYDMETLKHRATLFFQRYSEPLAEGEYDRPFILFASKLSAIESELKKT